ncbi:tetratricopeptide repeat protein [Zhouia sp. PK063]|uniref:tetratricopeptide repeat protein n=1 Tax=Zhouia sp. PK063 TaxID=3373602 RepID=UPI0037BDBF26
MKKLYFVILLGLQFSAFAQSSATVIGDSLYALQNYSKAITYYEQETTSHTKLQIAKSYHALGNDEKAIELYENLLNDHPNLLIAQSELGKLYLTNQKFKKADSTFTVLIGKDHSNPDFFYQKARAQDEMNMFDAAVINFKNAVRLDPHHLKSIAKIGLFYIKMKLRDSVLKYVDAGLEFTPNNKELLNIKATALYNEQYYKKALPVFEQLVKLGVQKSFIYEKLGKCYFNDIEYEKALECYLMALKLDFLNPNVDDFLFVSDCYLELKKYDLAEKYAKSAIKFKFVTFEAEYTQLADIYLDKRDLKTGLDYLKKAFDESEKIKPSYYLYYRICLVSEKYYQDYDTKIKYYENYLARFGGKDIYYDKFVNRKIKYLKTEKHMGASN